MPIPSSRRLNVQPLEQRVLLAGDWHNQSFPQDVNGDAHISSRDALRVINVIDRLGSGKVDDLQSDAPSELDGGFHPDVNRDGRVTALDALQVINRMVVESTQSDEATIGVHADDQGRPLRVVFTAVDGRSHEVDISQEDVDVSWSGRELTILTQDNEPRMIAKPSVGILEGDFTGEDGRATVIRFDDQSATIETYLCVPGFNPINPTPIDIVFPDPDVRRPIDGFEETLGAIVQREIRFQDGTLVVHEFQEMSNETLLSVRVNLPSGQDAVAQLAASEIDQTNDPIQIQRDLLFLLREGQQPDAPMSLEELSSAVASVQNGLSTELIRDYVFTYDDVTTLNLQS